MTWLTAREISGLPEFAMTERAVRDKLARLGIPARPRPGREGGGGREYDACALPAPTRAAIAARSIERAGIRALAAVGAPIAAPAPALPRAPAPCPSPAPALARPPSQADKAVADARMQLVAMVQELVPLHGMRQACALLSSRIDSSGEGGETRQGRTLAAVARAANQRARGSQVSARTLERWTGMHRKSGWWGLLPAATAPEQLPTLPEDVAAVLGLYHSRDARFRQLSGAAREVTRMLERDIDDWRPLYHRARRALGRLGRSAEASVALIKARHSGSERAARLPYRQRDASMLAPLDVFVMDGHTFKAKVRHPDHGAPFAPELTMVIDWSTRMIMGWSVSLSENVIAVGDALRHAIGQWGIPAIVYSDNGPGETAKALDCPIDGIMARLGIDHRTGIPGHPQGRGVIERGWQTHAIQCARQFSSYQGPDADGGRLRQVAAELASEQRALKRAQRTGEAVRLSAKAPTWAQFVDAVERMVREYNTEHRHRGLPRRADGKHMTPAEAWADRFDPGLQHKPAQADLRELFMPAVLRTARRGQVTLFNQHYQAAELMRRDVDGREVSVRYDIHDPQQVRIYTLDGEFVCDAQWNANRIDAMPKAIVQIARERRVAAAIKRRTQQIETALRELDGPLQAPQRIAQEDAWTLSPPPPPAAHPLTGQPREQAAGRPFFDAPSDRYEWLMRHRSQWTPADGAWLRSYVASDDYAQLRDYYEGRGMGGGHCTDPDPDTRSDAP